MELLPHTLQWCKGEMLEARLILAFGIALITMALSFYFLGTTPASKAMLWPLLTLGMICSIGAGVMLYNNQQRLSDYPQQYTQDPAGFVQAEKARAENFISWYPKTRYIISAIALVGLALFLLSHHNLVRAISIALLLLVVATFVIDHFSEERANVYYQQILAAEKTA